jgi:hypothetical protein
MAVNELSQGCVTASNFLLTGSKYQSLGPLQYFWGSGSRGFPYATWGKGDSNTSIFALDGFVLQQWRFVSIAKANVVFQLT